VFFNDIALCNVAMTIGKTMCLLCCNYSLIFLRLSFALAASQMKDKARVVAMDLRGHGKSTTNDDLDLSIEVCPSCFQTCFFYKYNGYTLMLI
jgi:pimeloyl-ACP methyl ester carboxylesterase